MEQLGFEVMQEVGVPSEAAEVELDEEGKETVADLMARATLTVVRTVEEDDNER